jgi:hypothetical protein
MAELGYMVETAIGGVECLAKLRQRKSVVLVLEQNILWGGADGVLARMRDDDIPSVPVVLVCDGTGDCAAECVDWPVACRLRKPHLLTDLIDAVTLAERLSHGHWARQGALRAAVASNTAVLI